jgi:hypothetical protein
LVVVLMGFSRGGIAGLASALANIVAERWLLRLPKGSVSAEQQR